MAVKNYFLYRGVVVLGALLLAVGILFNQRGWPDAFFGLYSGPAFIFLGLLLEGLYKEKSEINENVKPLSSRATFFYKFMVPFLGGIALIIYFAVVFYNKIMMDLMIPLGVFCVFMWGIMLFIGVSVNYVFLTPEAFLLKEIRV